ncbi:hypothetical protein AAT17_00295 [Nonlabens sp. MIC269]|uniref:hypothetical protein n=1 Tax=Nonlabens sp. MIC269 TaxID=1476901 RepID=UPI00071EAA03|nr:hypothetical protein [Nonlabens sp. MIC269]ALM19808.1 hypothetical protein AAT17_00295 [Nonlabens sp. MIC269]
MYYSKNNALASKIILTDSKFRIIESNGNEVVKHKGIYQLNDSTLTLIFDKESSLPIITSTKNITIKSQSETPDRQKMTIISAIDDNPAWLAEIVLRDASKKIIRKMKPNFDGEVILENLDKISEVEISSQIDARTMIFDFQKYKNQNIEIKLEPIKWGGETVKAPYCGIVYATQPVIVAKIERDKDTLIKIFIDEKVYLAER